MINEHACYTSSICTHRIFTVINTKAISKLPEYQRAIFLEFKMAWEIFSVDKRTINTRIILWIEGTDFWGVPLTTQPSHKAIHIHFCITVYLFLYSHADTMVASGGYIYRAANDQLKKKKQDVEVLKMCLYVSDILVSSQGSSWMNIKKAYYVHVAWNVCWLVWYDP